MSFTSLLILLGISILLLAVILFFLIYSRQTVYTVTEDGEQITDRRTWRDALRFMAGPLPISISIHVAVILFLLWGVHVVAGPSFIPVRFQSGGGGNSNHKGDELKSLNMPEMPMPEMAAPVPINRPIVAVHGSEEAIASANHYVREASGGIGFGGGRGGGIGTGYGQGVGEGFGGFIGGLRRSGLDVTIVIDGTGSMKRIIDDVKNRMRQLVLSIHRLVPTARIGIVVFGGRGESIQVQPLTVSPDKLLYFLNNITAHDGGEWQEDTLGAVRTAVDDMGWRPSAKKVIVLVGDTPPFNEDFQPVLQEIRRFKEENGTFNTVDVTVEEHEAFDREWAKDTGDTSLINSALPEFYTETQHSYQWMALTGGGSWRSLTKDQQINQQVLILAFGSQWQREVSAFGRGISNASDP
ncbi:MAG TPA: vWA domain-containing protein [Candidatus Binataceae bacterium]|nr:vWA domain-containing protein [Candidatus Binataceae bacterium]